MKVLSDSFFTIIYLIFYTCIFYKRLNIEKIHKLSLPDKKERKKKNIFFYIQNLENLILQN